MRSPCAGNEACIQCDLGLEGDNVPGALAQCAKSNTDGYECVTEGVGEVDILEELVVRDRFAFCTHFCSFSTLFCFARALWQIALPPLGGVAAIYHRPLGGWRRSNEQKLTHFECFWRKKNTLSGPQTDHGDGVGCGDAHHFGSVQHPVVGQSGARGAGGGVCERRRR